MNDCLIVNTVLVNESRRATVDLRVCDGHSIRIVPNRNLISDKKIFDDMLRIRRLEVAR